MLNPQESTVIKSSPSSSPKPSLYRHENESMQNTISTTSTRIPGIMTQSQPTTPRPENDLTYPKVRHVLRGRASLFTTETGPYFSSTKSFDNLYAADKQTLLNVRIQAKMDRGFFMADNDWTCYRRNYFQVSNVFDLQNYYHDVMYVKSDALYPVQRFLVGISAKVANGDKEIELVQHTPKRDKGPQCRPEPKIISPGGNLSMSNLSSSQNVVTFERIQFKSATANNGKRRAAQQYYVCVVDLYAETDRMELVKLASCQSAPLVVRGRSPGHYADSGLGSTRHPNTTNYTTINHSPPPPPPPSTTTTNNEENNHRYHTTSPIYSKSLPQLQQPQEMIPPVQPNNNYHPGGYSYYYPQYHSSLPPVYTNSYSDPYHHEDKIQQHPYPQDWQRARYNSSSSGSSSVPSPQPSDHYFQNENNRSYSPTTPTYVPLVAHHPNPSNGN